MSSIFIPKNVFEKKFIALNTVVRKSIEAIPDKENWIEISNVDRRELVAENVRLQNQKNELHNALEVAVEVAEQADDECVKLADSLDEALKAVETKPKYTSRIKK